MLALPGIYRVTMVSDAPVWWVVPNVIACLFVALLLQRVRRMWAFVPLTLLLMAASGMECFLIVAYEDFVRCGNLLSTFGTNTRESSNFAANNAGNLLWVIPVIILAVVALIVQWRSVRGRSDRSCRRGRTAHSATPRPIGAVRPVAPAGPAWRTIGGVGALMLASAIVANPLAYPPFNLFVQGTTAIVQTVSKKVLIPRGDDMTFGATRLAAVPDSVREIYVFGVGESLRYDHTTFAGYHRNTTPELAANPRLLAYSDYHSTATLTLYSVPMMLTRATTAEFNRNFTEKTILQPYREAGFKTFVICSSRKYLSQQPYLSRGCDGFIDAPNDAAVPHLVDSVAALYPKVFCVVQLFQCHSYYGNFTPEYDRYHPNLVSDPGVEDKDLYLNAYDNAVLYTDHVMAGILSVLDKPGVRSSFIFASDHGEVLDIHGHRRGNNMAPPPAEYHVPFFFWSSEPWAAAYPAKQQAAEAHRDAPVNGDALFYTALDMADITIPESLAAPTWSVLSPDFTPHPRELQLPDGRTTLVTD